MGLKEYRKKRHFAKTPEPKSAGRAGSGGLRFVVQKHDATRLHYDFRLEVGGVMWSWAIPKGPSLDPGEKRLAVHVEDHPLSYRQFEGTIPAGNYGAGSVIVWDEGTYSVPDVAGRKATEAAMTAGMTAGHLKFTLHGQKLQGDFSLIQLKRGGAKNWLLIKKADDFASADGEADERSVLSGRAIDDIGGPKRTPAKKKPPAAKPEKKKSKAASPMVRPMLATLVDEPFDRPGWIFEVKWDGYRAIADVHDGAVKLYSRNHKSFDERFAPIAESLAALKHDAVIDGEVVALDDKGRSRFQLLQNYQKSGQGLLVYYAFDLLELDGRDLREMPLTERKKLLKKAIAGLPLVKLSEHIDAQGVAFFRAAAAQGLEGVIAKNGASAYCEGVRGDNWLKIKTHRRQEAVIGGYTEPRGSRKRLGALLLGVYDKDDLIYIGHTGGGLDQKQLADLADRLEPLERRTCPFVEKPKANAPEHWVTPKLICEVTFQEWTDDGRMRQPIFLALRDDKPAKSVRREPEHQVQHVVANGKPRSAKKVKSAPAPSTKSNGNEPPLTHLDKVYWPDDGYTKGDLIEYYRSVTPVILPYLRDRPESLFRSPNGIRAPGFFQKNVTRQPPPDWVTTIVIPKEDGGKVRYVVCNDARTLLYLANLGCIEINPWNSRVKTPDRPDYLIIDLDPEAIPFSEVIEAAKAVHKVLDSAGVESYCKTSGKTGLHIFVPLAGKYSYEQARQFAEVVANVVHRVLPKTTSVVRSPAKRQKRIYLDYLQNSRGQTLAAPYSVRPAPGAPVSTPLKWSEVKAGLDPAKFTIKTMAKRLDRVGDLWSLVLGPGIDLEACLERLVSGKRRVPTGVSANSSDKTKL